MTSKDTLMIQLAIDEVQAIAFKTILILNII